MTPPDPPPIIVDTNVVSYLYRNNPIGRPYLARMDAHRAVISFQTYEELIFGALNANWGQRRRDRLLRYLDTEYVMIEALQDLVKVCASLRAQSRRIGRELSAADAWIAATAVLLNCPLLSHDRDFGNLPGLEVIHYDGPANDPLH